jgi:hypothetical protein
MTATNHLGLRRILRFLTTLAGVVAFALGGFLMWFATAWADAWGGEADLAPGLGFLAAGAALLTAQRLLRPRRSEPAGTGDRG